MGLDMFAYRTSVKFSKPVDFQDEIKMLSENGEDAYTEIAYWRKHPNLHGWMEDLYYKKGGIKESFNCVPVELDLEDLVNLEIAIKEKMLPHTSGFFFGESDTDDEAIKADLKFIKDAKEAIFSGDRVFYDSWW
jgi:hypothetical protein